MVDRWSCYRYKAVTCRNLPRDCFPIRLVDQPGNMHMFLGPLCFSEESACLIDYDLTAECNSWPVTVEYANVCICVNDTDMVLFDDVDILTKSYMFCL